MSLANMRKNEVRAVIAACQACGHKADVNVDALPETIFVPETGRWLRCRCAWRPLLPRPDRLAPRKRRRGMWPRPLLSPPLTRATYASATMAAHIQRPAPFRAATG
jgi:hypothetical protein